MNFYRTELIHNFLDILLDPWKIKFFFINALSLIAKNSINSISFKLFKDGAVAAVRYCGCKGENILPGPYDVMILIISNCERWSSSKELKVTKKV